MRRLGSLVAAVAFATACSARETDEMRQINPVVLALANMFVTASVLVVLVGIVAMIWLIAERDSGEEGKRQLKVVIGCVIALPFLVAIASFLVASS